MDQSLLPNIYDFISHTYPFSKLDPLEKDAVTTAVKISYHSTQDELCDETLAGAGLFMIRTGAAEEVNPDGSLRAKLCVGDTFGYTQIEKEGRSDYKVTFPENTLLYLIPRTVLQFVISRSKTVGDYFNSNEWVRLRSSHSYSDEEQGLGGFASMKVGECCRRPLPVLTLESTIRQAAQAITSAHGYLAVIADQGALKGVVTKSDLAARAIAAGLPYSERASRIMTPGVISIDAQKPLYQALDLMVMHNLRCIPVTENGAPAGYITPSQMLQNSTLSSVYLLHDIRSAPDLKTLVKLSGRTRGIFRGMVGANMQPRSIQRMMSRIADVFSQVLIAKAAAELGPAPCGWAWFAAGSLARTELQFLSDQDSGIVTERETTKEEDQYFATLADRVCHELDECGYPLCEGNYMASNPKWRQSYSSWARSYDEWIACNSEEAILSSMVFLDIRYLYGDEFLVNKLRDHLRSTVSKNSRFLATLCTIGTKAAPPLGTFRQFVLTNDGKNTPYLDIKKQGVNLVIALARLYGLQSGSTATETLSRLKDAVASGALREEDFRELSEAFTFLNSVRFAHQLAAMDQGQKLTNTIVPSELSQFERNHLRDAFRIIAKQQQAARVRFASGMGILR